jgi:hypothetical protein
MSKIHRVLLVSFAQASIAVEYFLVEADRRFLFGRFESSIENCY